MNRTLFPSTPKAGQLTIIAPVNKGGTGGKNVIQAAQNLGGINTGSLDVAGGVLKSDANNKIQAENFPASAAVGPTIVGSKELVLGQAGKFKISNYDSLTNYTLAVSSGAVSILGDTITINPLVLGPVDLTVNGRVYKLTVVATRPVTPVVVGTTAGNGSTATITLTGSAFAMIAGSQTQRSADWELYSDPLMINRLNWSTDDLNNLRTWSVPSLQLNTTYYGRVRYRSANGTYSEWSYLIPVATQASYYSGTEEAKLVSSTPDLENMGFDVAVTRDGSRVFVASVGDYTAGKKGCVYVFVRSGNNWTQEARLVQNPAVQTTADRFGQAVATDSDGTRIVIGVPNATVGSTAGVGGAYVFVRSGTTWTQEQKLNVAAPDNYVNSYNGNDISITSDGTRVVMGSYQLNNQGQNAAGGAFVFVRNGTTWTQEAKIVPSDLVASDGFGSSVSISGDGLRIIVGAVTKSGTTARSGAAYIFSRVGSTWTQEAKISTDTNIDANFGQSVCMSKDGSRVVVGSPNFDGAGVGVVGAVYTYVRSGVSWTLEAAITYTDGSNVSATQAKFGFAVEFNDDSSRLIVGAFNQSRPGEVTNTRSGFAYTFSRVNNTWVRNNTIQPSDPAKDGNFGYSVAYAGDGSRTVVGCVGAKTGSSVTGATYIQR